MCGFVGFIAKQSTIHSSLIHEMGNTIVHRGPDDVGYLGMNSHGQWSRWNDDSPNETLRIGLGFRRLSIIDLSDKGAQPMATPDGRYWILFNGQIYNYIELKKQLNDVDFRSQSDTEVLLYAFAKYGPKVVQHLKGMFAFTIVDTVKERIFCFRDHSGVKPLYYTESSDGVYFGSEVRPLLQAIEGKPRLRKELLSRYLLCGWIPDPDTLFESIYKVEPGSYLEISFSGDIKKERYWNYQSQPMESPELEDWVEKLEAALDHSVKRQMRSDVPLGFFLSGGIDSSLLTAKGTEFTDRIGTFTTGFKWSRSRNDDLDIQCARLMKHQFPIDYHELILEPSILGTLPKVVQCLEEPIADPAAICSYLICEAAKEKFKVMISGQGADEVFGGYPIYPAGAVVRTLNQLPSSLLSLGRLTSDLLPYSVGPMTLQSVHRLRKVMSASRSPWPEGFALLRSALQKEQLSQLLTNDVSKIQADPFARHTELWETAKEWETFDQMMFLDFKTYLPNLNLSYGDKTSMAHSVELRVPFLDQEVIELTQKIPSRFKSTMTESKLVLKELAQRSLPHKIIHRPKTGFGLPLRDWFLKDLQPMARDLLSAERLQSQGLYNAELPEKWLKEHSSKKADHCMKLYTLMTLQLWIDEFEVQV